MKKLDLFEYIAWRGDLDFRRDPYNGIDNLVFSLLSYIDYSDIAEDGYLTRAYTLSEVISQIDQMPPERKHLGAMIPKQIIDLAFEAANSVRFGDARVFGYKNIIDEQKQSQFCAVSFALPSGEICVAYRGTDDTLVGWKENLNMSFLSVTSAQETATNYLHDVAAETSAMPIYVCGHSKGGNLAIWASVNSKKQIRDRIVHIYNNDGPGFCAEFISSQKYRAMAQKITTFIPQSSVVGMFFEHDENRRIVKCVKGSIMQHDIFSWRIKGTSPVCVESVSRFSKKSDENIKQWLASLEMQERREFVDTLYSLLCATGAKTLSELNKNKIKSISAFGKALRSLEPSAEENFRYVIGKMINKKLALGDLTERKKDDK